MSKKTKMVHVDWVDSAIKSGNWQQLEPVRDFAEDVSMRCDTVGLLVHEDESNITIASSYADTDEVYGVIKIPVCAVVKMKTIGKVKIGLGKN